MSKLELINPKTEEVIYAPQGFSWTTLCFGLFVPLIRGYYIYFFILALLCVFGFGFLIAWLVCPFLINGQYISWLRSKGFVERAEYERQKKREQDEDLLRKAMMKKIIDS